MDAIAERFSPEESLKRLEAFAPDVVLMLSGAVSFHEDRDFARIDLDRTDVSPPVEQLTLAIDSKPGGGGTIALTWANSRYSVPVTVASK